MAAEGNAILLNFSLPSSDEHQVPNSSYENPKSSEIDFPCSQDRRVIMDTGSDATSNDAVAALNAVSELPKLDPVLMNVEKLPSFMPRLNDPAFYEQLVRMKEEHRKTLERCEKRYLQKVEEMGVEINENTQDLLEQNQIQVTESEQEDNFGSSESVMNVPHLVVLENRVVSEIVQDNDAIDDSYDQNEHVGNVHVYEHQEIVHPIPPRDKIIDLSTRSAEEWSENCQEDASNGFEQAYKFQLDKDQISAESSFDENLHQKIFLERFADDEQQWKGRSLEKGTWEPRGYNDGLRESYGDDENSNQNHRYDDNLLNHRQPDDGSREFLRHGNETWELHRHDDSSLVEDDNSDNEHEGSERERAMMRAHNDTRQRAMERITDMWSQFNINDCQPSALLDGKTGQTEDDSASAAKHSHPHHKGRAIVRSSSTSRLSPQKCVRSKTPEKSWKGRVTVPKPFTMSVRESNKPNPSPKTRAMVEVAERRAARQALEDLECQRKFKATPPPAHILEPLFDEIVTSQKQRREHVQQHGPELLHAMQRPFQFTLKAEEAATKNSSRRPRSAPGHSCQKASTRASRQFKAHPFPAHIFQTVDPDIVEEEALYQEIRKRMRADELLKSSTLPTSMKVKGWHYTDGRDRRRLYKERANKAGLTAEHSFRPNVNHSIPDFEESHRQLVRMMESRKHDQEVTVCKPFNLRTASLSTSRRPLSEKQERIRENIKQGNQWIQREQRGAGLAKHTKDMAASSTGYSSTYLNDAPATYVTPSQRKLGLKKMAQRQDFEKVREQQYNHDMVESRSYKQQLNERNRQLQEGRLYFEDIPQNIKQYTTGHNHQSMSGKHAFDSSAFSDKHRYYDHDDVEKNDTFDVIVDYD